MDEHLVAGESGIHRRHDFDTLLVDEATHPLRGEITRDSEHAGKIEDARATVGLQRSYESSIEVSEVPLSISALRGRHRQESPLGRPRRLGTIPKP